MKKIKPALLVLLSLITGAAVGFVRGNIFHKHYDAYAGVILNDASFSIGLMTAFLAVFAVISFIICKASCHTSKLSRRLTALDKVQIILGSLIILYSAVNAFMIADGGIFIKCFAVTAILGILWFILAVSDRRGTMADLLSCASIVPAVLMLLGIYKTNIKYPNISLFSFEVLAALFIMLGFYFVSAANFKRVRGHMPVWMTCLSLLFSAASVVSHYTVVRLYIFEPVLSLYSILYFIGANVVLLGFTLRVEAEKEEKLVYYGEGGFVVTNGVHSIAIDCDTDSNAVFTSVKGGVGTLTEEDTRYVIEDFAVCGFVYDGENEPVYGQHITTPNGKTLLNLMQASSENLGSKLVKSLGNEYEKVDYILLSDSEKANDILNALKGLIKANRVIKLSENTEITL